MVSGPNSEDSDLAESLRRDDPEQFHTLVRMHLSFVLDLNTDDCDGVVEKVGKFRPTKWSFTPFAKKAKPSARPTVEGVVLTRDVNSQVYQLMEWLGKEQNICQEGIFRRSGKMTRQQELKTLLTNGDPLELDEGRFSVHDGASVLKNFLAQLPEPLLTEAHYPAHCQIAELCSGPGEVEEERLLKALQLILLLLPIENLLLLKALISLLHLTSNHAHINKMSADNLATLFTPHLLCPRKLSPEALHTNSQIMSRVVSFMIRQGPLLFHIPTQLATDIRAYWTSREKRKLMTKKDLNESVCDGMAAKTVFTFVDQKRTAEANGSANPTEAALAQLYAHIQSLPESSKKRKLIKQFNKENGQGTPQLVAGTSARASRTRQRNMVPNSAKPRQRSRSLGDSIKKHIPVFNKAHKDAKKNGEEHCNRDIITSPHSSPASKVKLFFQKSTTEGERAPGSGSMPALKKSLMNDSGGEAKTLRMRLSANAKRTPTTPSALRDSTSDREECTSTSSNDSHSTGDERRRDALKRVASSSGVQGSSNEREGSCAPPKSPRVEPEIPFSVPLPPSLERAPSSPEAKRLQGTCRDDSWPVSTVPASASSNRNRSPTGLPNTHVLTTPRNVLAWMTSTPACARVSCPMDSPLNNCLLTPSTATGNNSMSPITRSTQKMPRAMQEDMMTPRSRKPVVALSSSNLCQLAHLNAWGQSDSGELRRDATSRAALLSEAGASLNRKLTMREESFTEQEDARVEDCDESVCIPIERMLAKEVLREPSTVGNEASCEREQVADHTEGCECCPAEKCASASGCSADYYSCSSEGSALTGTFREIVLSRSVLSASPVDLSFSSRTGDFDSSSEREAKLVLSTENLSESLLYCLDGNDPSCLSENDNSCNSDERKSHFSGNSKSFPCDNDLDDSHFESSGAEATPNTTECSGLGINSLPDSKVTTDKESIKSKNNSRPGDSNDSLLSAELTENSQENCIVNGKEQCGKSENSVRETTF